MNEPEDSPEDFESISRCFNCECFDEVTSSCQIHSRDDIKPIDHCSQFKLKTFDSENSCEYKAKTLQQWQAEQEPEEDILSIAKARDAIQKKFICLFADENGDSWVQYMDQKKKKFCPIQSQQFMDFLRVKLNEFCKVPKESWVEPLCKLFDSMARRKEKRTLYLRAANHKESWLIQLTESTCAKIQNGEIKIMESPPVFRIFPHQLPIEADLSAQIDDLNLLDQFLNFSSKKEGELFKDRLGAHLIPNTSKAIELVRGPPNSGKSSLGRIFVTIVDPSESMIEGMPWPENDNEWHTVIRQHRFMSMDNLNKISPDQQDQACRFVTGTSFKKRKLYTDFETVQMRTRGGLFINAIDLSGLRSDFIERAIINDLAEIKNEKRIGDLQFNQAFRKDLPRIMGALLKVLAKAQLLYPSIPAPRIFRLNDFAHWGAACAAARGRSYEDFLNDLEEKVALQFEEALNQNVVALPILEFMENKTEWSGTSSELLKLLTEEQFGIIEGTGAFERMRIKNVPRYWPKDPRTLGKEMKYAEKILRYNGIDIQRGRTGAKRLLELRKREKTTSLLSFSESSVDKSDDKLK